MTSELILSICAFVLSVGSALLALKSADIANASWDDTTWHRVAHDHDGTACHYERGFSDGFVYGLKVGQTVAKDEQ